MRIKIFHSHLFCWQNDNEKKMFTEFISINSINSAANAQSQCTQLCSNLIWLTISACFSSHGAHGDCANIYHLLSYMYIYNFCQFNSITHSPVHANLIVCLFGQYLAGLFKLAVQVRCRLIKYFQIGRLFRFCRWKFIQILTSIDYSFIGYILRISIFFFVSKYKTGIKCVSNKKNCAEIGFCISDGNLSKSIIHWKNWFFC